MRWQVGRRSGNVVDRRGMGAGGLGAGAVIVVMLVSWLFGVDTRALMGVVEQTGGVPAQDRAPPAGDPQADFASAILGETEDVWTALFQQAGNTYQQPRLVLFSGAVRSACGGATAATGPFYCPADQQLYLDFSFFDAMEKRLGGGGDFADAYVIAHEVGHHVQTLTGDSQRVDQIRSRGGEIQGASGPLVRLELQADCLAGIWAHHAQQRHQWLEAGDVEEALNTASAIGDDRLQRQGRGEVVPDSFTHGTSEQRVRWFKTGFESGQPGKCDTFAAARL